MQAIRIYSGDGGGALFQTIEVAFDSEEDGAHTMDFPIERMFFRRFSPGLELGHHKAPRRQWLIVVSGVFDVGGEVEERRFKPGDIIFIEDVEGLGHTTKNIQGERITAYLPVPASFQIAQAIEKPPRN
jgi:hypothetical protein